jgi:hypothetical protein
VSSATLKISNNAVVNHGNVAPFALFKRIVVLEDSLGTMRVDYDLECTVPAGGVSVHGQSRIYRGATLLWSGVDNPEAAGPTTFSDAAIAQDLLAGDTIEVWGYRIGATSVEISNMRIYYTGSITSLSRRLLTTALPITGADMLYTNVY